MVQPTNRYCNMKLQQRIVQILTVMNFSRLSKQCVFSYLKYIVSISSLLWQLIKVRTSVPHIIAAVQKTSLRESQCLVSSMCQKEHRLHNHTWILSQLHHFMVSRIFVKIGINEYNEVSYQTLWLRSFKISQLRTEFHLGIHLCQCWALSPGFGKGEVNKILIESSPIIKQ